MEQKCWKNRLTLFAAIAGTHVMYILISSLSSINDAHDRYEANK